MDQIKIGIVCYPTFGGSGVVATELGKALAQEGHKVHFITYSQPSRLDFLNENIFYHEVDFRSYPLFEYAPYELALASKMVNVAMNEKLDLFCRRTQIHPEIQKRMYSNGTSQCAAITTIVCSRSPWCW